MQDAFVYPDAGSGCTISGLLIGELLSNPRDLMNAAYSQG